MTRKPINQRKRRLSRNETNSRWLKQAGWLVKTINELHVSPTAHGLKWTKNMILHYNKQYQNLRSNTPKASESMAITMDSEISAIIKLYSD